VEQLYKTAIPALLKIDAGYVFKVTTSTPPLSSVPFQPQAAKSSIVFSANLYLTVQNVQKDTSFPQTNKSVSLNVRIPTASTA